MLSSNQNGIVIINFCLNVNVVTKPNSIILKWMNMILGILWSSYLGTLHAVLIFTQIENSCDMTLYIVVIA